MEENSGKKNSKLDWLMGTSRTTWKWLTGVIKIPNNAITAALVALLVSALIASFPVPAPDMSIIEPNNNQKFDVVYNKTTDKGDKPAIINVNITAHPGFCRYLLYDNEFLHRFFKNLRMDPKIWVLVKKNDSERWTVYHEAPYFKNGYEIVQVKLWYPTTWDIAVISFNARDGEYLRGYMTTIEEAKGNLTEIFLPNSGFIKQKIRVTTINTWRS